MSENRLPDYIDHIQQAAADVCSFVEDMTKDDFLADKRTQQAVIMSFIVPPARHHSGDQWQGRFCQSLCRALQTHHASCGSGAAHAFGDKVIDHERVTGLGDDVVEVAALYQVADGLIQTVWFLPAQG